MGTLKSSLIKGEFKTIKTLNSTVHVYCSGDVMADASFIVEGKEGLVLLETPLFKENHAEFYSYVNTLGKPVVKVIVDYHEGNNATMADVIMPEGMPLFMRGNIYGGMMAGFKNMFGDTMVELNQVAKEEVPFGKTITLAGISFTFNHGASSDFPGSSIIIDSEVYLTHWAPSKSHISPLQVGSLAAADAEIEESRKALTSGCTHFVGGHGMPATTDDVSFKIEYLTKVKDLRASCESQDAFIAAMTTAYPGLPMEQNLSGLAAALYK